MRFMMHQNEAFHAFCFSLSVKMALGIGLFCNALLALGSERHEKVYKAALNGEVSDIFKCNSIVFLIINYTPRNFD